MAMTKRNNEKRFLARCASGFENVLANELIGLHCKRVESIKGGATFAG